MTTGESARPRFEEIIAIDWSGAQKVTGGIQVASCHPGADAPNLLEPPNHRKHWTRECVLGYITEKIVSGRMLIGIDFSFSYPYHDRNAYFPGHSRSPIDAPDLWMQMEYICQDDYRLLGQRFRDDLHPFMDYVGRGPNRLAGPRYETRFRVTEEMSKRLGCIPKPALNFIGPGQVAAGSVAGQRMLHRLHRNPDIAIWPFNRVKNGRQSVLVEIYPAVFTHDSQFDQMVCRCKIKHYGKNDGDKVDALVSAAGITRWIEENPGWVDFQDSYEGWILGVPINDGGSYESDQPSMF